MRPSLVLFLAIAVPAGCTGSSSAAPRAETMETAEGGSATVHGLTIPVARPRLWFTPDRLAKARAWWDKKRFTPAADIWMHLAFAATVTNKPGDRAKWCNAAVANAIAKTNAMPMQGSGCNECRWSGEDVIVAYDWCNEFFTPQQRKDFIDRTNAWMEHWRTASWGGPHMTQNNYFWGNVRNELEWGIASYHENKAAAEVFIRDALTTRWKDSFVPTVASYNRGGVFHEGAAYGRYIAHYPVIPFQTARLAGLDVFGESEFWKSAVLNLIYQTTPAPTYNAQHRANHHELFPFNDDSFWPNGGSAMSRLHNRHPGSFYGDFMQTIADYWPSSPIGQWAQQWVDMVGVGPHLSPWVQAAAGSTTPRPFSSLPLDYYAGGIQYMYARAAWDASSTVLHLQLGMPREVGHMHSDYGNWQLWRGGRWLSRETTDYGATFAGYGGTGTIGAISTTAHNGILINPDSQGCTPGSTCLHGGDAAIYDDLNGPPVMRRLESRPAYFYANADLSSAYRNHIRQQGAHKERDNPAAKHVEREYVFVRGLETLVILDRLESNPVGGVPADRIKKTFVAHCEVAWTMDDPQRSTCTNGAQALRLSTLVPASTTRSVIREGGPTGQHRLEVTTSGAAQTYFLHVLQAKASAAPSLAPSVADTGRSFVVTLDPDHSITFVKGMTSSGGSITVRGTTTSFRGDVQPMIVTDEGPVWQSP